MKLGRDYIEAVAGGPKGILGNVQGDGAERVANALDQYYKAINFMKPEDRTPENIEKLKNEVANAYRPATGASAPELDTLPDLPGIQKGRVYTKTELKPLLNGIEEEIYNTWVNRTSGPGDEALAQRLNYMTDALDKYLGAYNRMADDPVGKPQGK